MLFPAFVSWLYDESDVIFCLQSAGLAVVIGLPIWFMSRKSRKLRNRDGFIIVTFSWIITALAGALPFYISGAIPNFTDAFFEAMSGVTTTGASILGNQQTLPHLQNGIESLSHGLLFWRSFLQWIGGMGIILFTIAILPLLGVGGVQLFKAEVPGPVTDKLRPRVRETAKLLWIVYLGITVLETLLLGIAGMGWFDAICHAFTTMPTGGFSTKNASIEAYNSGAIEYIIIIFMIIAGTNFSLHFRALSGNINSHITDKEFKVYFSLIFFVTAIIFLRLALHGEISEENFRASLFQTVSLVTTTGFSSADYELWPYFVQCVLLCLMFVGGMGGSTGGGMKIIRVFVLFKYMALATQRMLHTKAIIPIRIGNRFISEDVISNTLGFFLFYVSIFIFTTVALTLMNVNLESAIGAAASAIGNIGPGLADFGPTDNYALLPDFGKWLLTFCMLLGRLEIFTIIVIFSRVFWK
ncbi:MAG TPA: TrkH family potassium uptake protein [Candidatus Marinimicrobia bacterium]|nr:TrkH family potassium uptake protein [Candidatus Neomarinimicrobiota bacterium]